MRQWIIEDEDHGERYGPYDSEAEARKDIDALARVIYAGDREDYESDELFLEDVRYGFSVHPLLRNAEDKTQAEIDQLQAQIDSLRANQNNNKRGITLSEVN